MNTNMRNRFVKKLAVLFAVPVLFFAGAAHGAAVGTGNVLQVGTYGNGNLFIVLDATIPESGCSATRVDIISTHPLLKTFMAMALTAKSAGTLLRVFSTGCFNFTVGGTQFSFPTVDTSNDGRMQVLP